MLLPRIVCTQLDVPLGSCGWVGGFFAAHVWEEWKQTVIGLLRSQTQCPGSRGAAQLVSASSPPSHWNGCINEKGTHRPAEGIAALWGFCVCIEITARGREKKVNGRASAPRSLWSEPTKSPEPKGGRGGQPACSASPSTAATPGGPADPKLSLHSTPC